MMYYSRNYISKGINLVKSNNSKKCIVNIVVWLILMYDHHYCFFNHEVKFQDSVCKGYHDLTMLSVNISSIAIISIKKC